ncbi:uncharacterized protein CC84DRAFT_273306 [Paraphaeosphaeria sporulosa]|uniref:Uncharacterized protein n=1 Tax=Paraphaeosphaeria sporulosa TaxID=1460663 RepID=A0A177C2S9_9PLEO|nr:uncharacterized protein CC84DRAFT_273306 [Paraphaeosphaeria sporulosa]OAG00940.1 hypothetical protein CC84DRAFT_273306 [Paraphaeosphaeria sporulosa]
MRRYGVERSLITWFKRIRHRPCASYLSLLISFAVCNHAASLLPTILLFRPPRTKRRVHSFLSTKSAALIRPRCVIPSGTTAPSIALYKPKTSSISSDFPPFSQVLSESTQARTLHSHPLHYWSALDCVLLEFNVIGHCVFLVLECAHRRYQPAG